MRSPGRGSGGHSSGRPSKSVQAPSAWNSVTCILIMFAFEKATATSPHCFPARATCTPPCRTCMFNPPRLIQPTGQDLCLSDSRLKVCTHESSARHAPARRTGAPWRGKPNIGAWPGSRHEARNGEPPPPPQYVSVPFSHGRPGDVASRGCRGNRGRADGRPEAPPQAASVPQPWCANSRKGRTRRGSAPEPAHPARPAQLQPKAVPVLDRHGFPSITA